MAALITSEMGTPLGFCKAVQVGNPVKVLRSYAQILGAYDWEGGARQVHLGAPAATRTLLGCGRG